jgi:CheY-like chemotaxis protein
MTRASHLRCHVLSIRDSPADRYLLERIWGEDPEIEITHLDGGHEALTYLNAPNRKLPNLIVLAFRFGVQEMSAAEILKAVKRHVEFRPIPVIVLADALSPDQINSLYENQAACVLEMPGDLTELKRILKLLKDLWMNDARLPF